MVYQRAEGVRVFFGSKQWLFLVFLMTLQVISAAACGGPDPTPTLDAPPADPTPTPTSIATGTTPPATPDADPTPVPATPTLGPVPVSIEDVSREHLPGMVLAPLDIADDLQGLSMDSRSGYLNAEDVADHTLDSEDTAIELQAEGYLDGYQHQFSDPSNPLQITAGFRVC